MGDISENEDIIMSIKLEELIDSRCCMLKDKYALEGSVMLLKNAAWQGERDHAWYFKTLKEAKEAKKIIKTMIKEQRRTGGDVKVIGRAERFFWGRRVHSHWTMCFWDVGVIKHYQETIIEE